MQVLGDLFQLKNEISQVLDSFLDSNLSRVLKLRCTVWAPKYAEILFQGLISKILTLSGNNPEISVRTQSFSNRMKFHQKVVEYLKKLSEKS